MLRNARTNLLGPSFADMVWLCEDSASGYAQLSAAGWIEHFVLGSKLGAGIAAGCYHIQNVNSLHARYNRSTMPLCGPATKNLNGYIRWLNARMSGTRPADIIRRS